MIFYTISEKMAHNVLAVWYVLVARIRALRSIVPEVRDQGWQNMGVVSRGNGA
jgi:hypothetical protein